MGVIINQIKLRQNILGCWDLKQLLTSIFIILIIDKILTNMINHLFIALGIGILYLLLQISLPNNLTLSENIYYFIKRLGTHYESY